MKICFFHLVLYRFLPDDSDKRHHFTEFAS